MSSDESVVISRIFLQKCKRLLKLITNYTQNKDLNKTILSAKPPIFWKEKEIVKKQIISWKIRELYKLIFDLNEIEFQIKLV